MVLCRFRCSTLTMKEKRTAAVQHAQLHAVVQQAQVVCRVRREWREREPQLLQPREGGARCWREERPAVLGLRPRQEVERAPSASACWRAFAAVLVPLHAREVRKEVEARREPYLVLVDGIVVAGWRAAPARARGGLGVDGQVRECAWPGPVQGRQLALPEERLVIGVLQGRPEQP